MESDPAASHVLSMARRIAFWAPSRGGYPECAHPLRVSLVNATLTTRGSVTYSRGPSGVLMTNALQADERGRRWLLYGCFVASGAAGRTLEGVCGQEPSLPS